MNLKPNHANESMRAIKTHLSSNQRNSKHTQDLKKEKEKKEIEERLVIQLRNENGI